MSEPTSPDPHPSAPVTNARMVEHEVHEDGLLKRANRFTRLLMFVVGGGLGVGSSFGGGWLALSTMRAEAQTVADAGVVRAEKVATEGSKALEQRVAMLEKFQLQQADDVRETKTAVNDVNRKLDAVLDKLRIPMPDGGRK